MRFAAAVLALAGCGVSQWYIRTGASYWANASVGLVAGALLAAALIGKPRNAAVAEPSFALAANVWRRAAGLLLAAVGAAGYGYGIFLLHASWNRNFDLAAPLLIAAVSLWSIALALAGQRGAEDPSRVPMPRWELALFFAVVAFGFFLRFYRFGEFPPQYGVHAVEEGQSGQAAHLLIHEHFRPWEFVGDRWLPVPFFLLFGETLTSLRAAFAVVSGLTLVPFYLTLRLLVARPVALFATALLAMSHWHLVYARSGHAVFPTTLIVTLIFYLCVRAHRRGGLAVYPWIGFLTGYTLYSYAGYRGTMVFVGLFFAISLLTHLRRWRSAILPERVTATRRVLIVQAAGLALAALAFAGPVWPLFPLIGRENPGYYFEAANRSLINGDYYTADWGKLIQMRVERLRQTAELFNHFGDGSETFNLPGEPMLDPVSGVLFTFGLAYCLIWFATRFQGFFAFVFLVVLTMGTIFVGNFDPRRLQGVIPPLFMLIAFAVDRFAEASRERLGRAALPVLGLLTVALGGYALYDNYDVYFVRLMHDRRVREAFQNQYTVAVSYLKTLPPNAYMLLVSNVQYFFRTSDYAWIRGDDIPGAVTADLLPVFLNQPGPWDGRQLYVVVQWPFGGQEIGALLEKRFPATKCQDVVHADGVGGRFAMTACRVVTSADGAPVQGGVRARYFRGNDAAPLIERLEPVISFAFMPAECHFPMTIDKQPCRAEWEGTFEVAESGSYEVSLEVNQGRGSATLDGAPLRAGTAVDLQAGPHSVHVEAQFTPVTSEVSDNGARLRWRKRGAPDWQLVTFAQFGSV